MSQPPPSVSSSALPEGNPAGWWKVGARLLVSVLVLTVLILKTPHLGGVLPHHNHLRTVILLGAALLLIFLGIVLQAWRWQQVLHVFGEHVGITRLTAYTLAGQFVGNVLPSTIGGDVVRISRVSADVSSSETAFASVVLERLTGFVALPALVLFGFALEPSLIHSKHAPLALVIAGITVAALIVILSAAAHPKLAGRFADNQSWTRFIGAVHVGVDRLRHYPRQALGVVGTSLAYQVSVIAAALCIVRTLELPVPVAALFAFVPAVAMAQAVPISIGGLGVREGMLVLFLKPLGVTTAQAIAVGLLWYAGVLAVSMLGAPAFAVGKRRQPPVPVKAA